MVDPLATRRRVAYPFDVEREGGSVKGARARIFGPSARPSVRPRPRPAVAAFPFLRLVFFFLGTNTAVPIELWRPIHL